GDPDGSIPEKIVGLDRLHETAAEADFVAVTVPLTPESRGLVDRQVLAALRADAWIINTGRGPVIEQTALLEALTQHRLGGAVLDVFDEEPLPPDSPLWNAPGAILTPHVSGSEAGTALRDLVAENLRRFAGLGVAPPRDRRWPSRWTTSVPVSWEFRSPPCTAGRSATA